MDKIMVLFRFIHGKDVFEAFYKKVRLFREATGSTHRPAAPPQLLTLSCSPSLTGTRRR